MKSHRSSTIKFYAKEIARCLREEYYTDPQGRSVRVNHAAPGIKDDGRQMMLWDDIRTASPEHVGSALRLRRQQIVGDCFQLKTDQDSFNDNNTHGAMIQLSLNFEKDAAELETIEDYGSRLRKKKPR